MAEDLNNPLNNPAAEPVGQPPTPRGEEAEPEPDQELADFLDDVLDNADTSAPMAGESTQLPEPAAPAVLPPSPENQSALDGGDEHPASPSPDGEAVQPAVDPLQHQVLERLNDQLERMGQPPAAQPVQAQPVTPEAMLQHYQPRIQQYVEAGYLDEDYVSLYPRQAALMVHMWDMGTNLQAGVQQTQQFTQAEQARRTEDNANTQLNTAIDEVASRGEVFGALSDTEVREGFREFLITEVNPLLSQVTPDFLARQFYAYNHQLIFDTIRQGVGADAQAGTQPAVAQAPTGAQLAQQEGSAARTVPAVTGQPDFADLLQGTTAEGWYQ